MANSCFIQSVFDTFGLTVSAGRLSGETAGNSIVCAGQAVESVMTDIGAGSGSDARAAAGAAASRRAVRAQVNVRLDIITGACLIENAAAKVVIFSGYKMEPKSFSPILSAKRYIVSVNWTHPGQ